MIYFSELQTLPTFDAKGEFLGRLDDLVVDPSQNARRVASYLVKTPKKGILCITHEQMQSISSRAAQTSVPAQQIRCYSVDEAVLRVKKDVLDQQIIDVNNRKVVRVNDVGFDIQPTDGHSELRVVAADVGMAAAIRRLLQGMMAKHVVRRVSGLFPARRIPWEFVNLIERDSGRRVRLRISYELLARLHPADIADILEALSRDDQRAVLEALDDETAAQALSEIPTRMQALLLEGIATDRAANIVEAMPRDRAADLLQELPPEVAVGLLARMEKDEAKEVRRLLEFEKDTAGALMTTEYVVVGEGATVSDTMTTLKHFEGPLDSVHKVYVVDSRAVLIGAASLSRILLADVSTKLLELSDDPLISVQARADEKEVVDLFHKYSLASLPVVDEKGHLLGVVTADDVLELLVRRPS